MLKSDGLALGEQGIHLLGGLQEEEAMLYMRNV